MSKKLVEFSLILFLFIIEFFYVIAPIMGNYNIILILTFLCLLILFLYYFLNKISILNMNNFEILLFFFLAYVILRVLCSQSYIDLFFYLFGFTFLIFFGSCKEHINLNYLLKVLFWFGLFFSIGVIFQMLFTEQFMEYYYPLFADAFKTSIRRQVVFHQMYPGWTSQTFATSINIIMGLCASFYLWYREKNYHI